MIKRSTIAIAFLLFAAFQTVTAANITIITSGFTYSPASTTGTIGDVVTITANANHPLVQVDQTNWNANSPTPMGGGWGTKTANYTFTITTVADIYYGCANHMSTMGMKGMITVTAAGISQATAAAYNISLYPNPVTGSEFTVKVEGYSTTSGKVMLYNEEGKLLETHTLTDVLTTVKTKLPSGVYFYDVMIGSTISQRSKFIVMQSK